MLSHKLTAGLRPLTAGILLTLVSGLPVFADDTEIFIGQGAVEGPEARPNILFIMDTSGSMGDRILTQPTYDPARTYAGACDGVSDSANRVYWGTNSTVPSCASNNWFNLSALTCQAALNAFNTATGFFSGRAARYKNDGGGGNNTWINLSNSIRDQFVECQADRNVHGQTGASTLRFARNASVGNPWGNSADEITTWNSRPSYRFYTKNYINWWNDNRFSLETKLEIVQNVTKNLIDSVSDVNVGLMRFSTDAQGGMVVSPVANVADNATTLKAEIDAFTAQGNTPLSETLYEAGLYLAGKEWHYGENSDPVPSIGTARTTPTSSTYKSPMEYSCQSNYIVYLTDGLPTTDTDANEDINNLAGTTCSGNGQCLDEMAGYLFNNDQSELPGKQNVVTYTVGFAVDFPLLLSTAIAGGGSYYTANDTASLSSAFTNIVQEILDTNSTFTSPTVAVNAFNRTQNLNDLFITVFKPTDSLRWPGNIKKYRLNPTTGTIQDANTPAQDAVDPTTGFFQSSARSYWSDVTDGDIVTTGGAANELPSPLTRNVYTYWSGSLSTELTNGSNSVSSANLLLVANMLLSRPLGGPLPTEVISWARGTDVKDEDADGDVLEARNRMGDPLHARPATVIYGGTTSSPDINDAVVFAATNEGYIHALDPVSGEELWSFIPDVMLPKLYDLYEDPPSSTKFYGVDGNMQVLKIDLNQNGIVEPADGDKVYLYFGMRRGGDSYYALDVTDKDGPEFMWKNTPTQLPGLAQTWSTPAVAKVNVNSGAQTQEQDYVLIFGGGYEEDQDPNSTTQLTAYSTDTTGNRIFMVDAATGARLWSAGGPSSGANLLLDGSGGKPTMNNSIPADIRVIDLDNDGYADRMYAGDMGGRVWRFDIFNGKSPTSPSDPLVTGGVFASLGNADETSHPAASTRRFYYAPDVALIRDDENTFLNVTIGSGYRASPLNLQVEDRIYALRDRNVFNKLIQAQYNSFAEITDADSGLIDVTTDITAAVPATAKGWKINLTTREGEKVLAEARTFQNNIFVTTYTPYDGEVPADPCAPRQGTNRLYLMKALNGAPVAEDAETPEDRVTDLAQGGIAPEAVFLFPTPDEDCEGAECKPEPQCLVGLENCGVELTNNPVRTFWTQQNVDN